MYFYQLRVLSVCLSCNFTLFCVLFTKMSIPPSNQDMEERPSLSTPLPEPNLNFTVQIHSLLNGESPADNNIPGAPVSILDTSSQGENNGAPDTRDGRETRNTLNIDEADTTSGQGARIQMRPPTMAKCWQGCQH